LDGFWGFITSTFITCTKPFIEPNLLFLFQDWPFDDGAAPPRGIVESWLDFLKRTFQDNPGATIAIHCVAGLGRAPVLVALALIEGGMKYEDAVQYIRQRRRGAINSKQLEYLEKYKPLKMFRGKEKACLIQ